MSDIDVSSLTSYASSLISNAQSTVSNSSASASVSSVNSGSTDEEMLDACKEFESYLWEQILKEVDKTSNIFGTESDGSYAGNMMSNFSDTFIQTVAEQLTDSGGSNSLAQTLYEQLKRNYSTVTADEIEAARQSEAVAESGVITEETEE